MKTPGLMAKRYRLVSILKFFKRTPRSIYTELVKEITEKSLNMKLNKNYLRSNPCETVCGPAAVSDSTESESLTFV